MFPFKQIDDSAWENAYNVLVHSPERNYSIAYKNDGWIYALLRYLDWREGFACVIFHNKEIIYAYNYVE